MNILVLGAGLVGRPAALDLASDKNFRVTVVDNQTSAIDRFRDHPEIKCIRSDISQASNISKLCSGQDIVLSAVPGFMGYETLKILIEEKKDVVDIAFSPEDVLQLDHLARKYDVRVISDFGVAPGMSHLLAASSASKLDTVEKIVIYVGGLPKHPVKPWEYKAVFSPADVIEEYTRPARIIEDGEIKVVEALSSLEELDFPNTGKLEAFISDGLRSLVKTVKAENMLEKTLRYPGYTNKIQILKDAGFFSNKSIYMEGKSIKPIDFTSKILFPQWKLEEGEEDITIMRIIVEGTFNNKKQKHQWDLYDEYNKKTRIHSMARTTGYTATAGIHLLAKGIFKRKGVATPEFLSDTNEYLDFILKYLEERGIIYYHSIS